MKQKINKIINTVMQTATFAFLITSCQKTQNIPAKRNSSENNLMLAISPCSQAIPDTLQVPAGNKLASQAYAEGVQIYQVQHSATDANVFKWVFIAPSATLYSDPDYTNQIGIHYAGPTWEFTKGFNKGEKVTAKKLREASVDVTAIPWLLLKTVDSLSSVNNKVTYIQRVCTEGGLAPITGADKEHLGLYDSIPYTATYLFYAAKH